VAQAETDTYLMIFVSLKYIVSPYGETSSYSETNVRERSADFLEVADKEDRDIIIRRVYEKINELLDILKISLWKEKLD
jgi:hypothetical protein